MPLVCWGFQLMRPLGFAAGKNTGSTVWGNKNSMDAAHLKVTIDGVQVL